MSERREPDPIARWFAELRRAEQGDVPRFAQSWEAALARAPRPPRRPAMAFQLAAAALLVLLAIPVLWRARPQAPARPPAGTVSITRWTSPTAFLMETPGRSMLQTVPRVGEGIVPINQFVPRSHP